MAVFVLVVTDYSGNLHITPVGNKVYYQNKNQLVKDKQFLFKEGLTEEQAIEYVQQNEGRDPNFITPSKAQKVIADKDAEVDALRKRIAELEASNSVTTQPSIKPLATAEDSIVRIKLAQSVDEVNAIIVNDTRKTVVDAANKRIAELSQQN